MDIIRIAWPCQYTIAMSTTKYLSLHTGEKITKKLNIIGQIEQAEKKAFTRHEAFDFHNELKKRNLELVVIVNDAYGIGARPTLVAYMAFSHTKAGSTVVLQKVCVREEFRRQGIGKDMLAAQVQRLKGRGTAKLQLWVDDSNVAARRLYDSIGFKEVSRICDYYAMGRVGVQMALSLVS